MLLSFFLKLYVVVAAPELGLSVDIGPDIVIGAASIETTPIIRHYII